MEGVTLYLVSPLVVLLKSLMSVGSVTDLILISLPICSSSFFSSVQVLSALMNNSIFPFALQFLTIVGVF